MAECLPLTFAGLCRWVGVLLPHKVLVLLNFCRSNVVWTWEIIHAHRSSCNAFSCAFIDLQVLSCHAFSVLSDGDHFSEKKQRPWQFAKGKGWIIAAFHRSCHPQKEKNLPAIHILANHWSKLAQHRLFSRWILTGAVTAISYLFRTGETLHFPLEYEMLLFLALLPYQYAVIVFLKSSTEIWTLCSET